MSSYSMQTDPGARYDENEDTVGCDEALNVWLVADGMGGHAAGEVASAIARDTFLEQTREGVDPVTSALNAHGAIVASAEAQQAQQGMQQGALPQAAGHERRAVDALGKLRQELEKASKGQGGGLPLPLGGRGRGNQGQGRQHHNQ